MTSTYLKAGAAIVLCAIAAYSFGLHRASTHAGSGLAERNATGSGDEAQANAAHGESEREVSDARPDMAALSAAVLRAAAADSQIAALATAAASPRPLGQARETLDLRMANAADNPRETARLEQALRGIIEPAVLGGASAEILCGSTICRIDVSHESDAGAQKATGALAVRVPKTFGGTAIYPQGSGARTIYVAKDSADLVVDPIGTDPKKAQLVTAETEAVKAVTVAADNGDSKRATSPP